MLYCSRMFQNTDYVWLCIDWLGDYPERAEIRFFSLLIGLQLRFEHFYHNKIITYFCFIGSSFFSTVMDGCCQGCLPSKIKKLF